MSEQPVDQRLERHEKLATAQPRLSVLTDRALSHEEAHRDSFRLAARVGPVFDILRHPKTKSPMAIAIYGKWGSGKTSAMQWLHSLLDVWTQKGHAPDKVELRPVWF